MAKKFLDKSTQEKISINSDNGHKELSKIIDLEKLHVDFGG